MDDLLKQIKQYKEPLVIGLAIIMLIFYGFCPTCFSTRMRTSR